MSDTPSKLSDLRKVLIFSCTHWRKYWRLGLVIMLFLLIDKLFWIYFSYSFKLGIDSITDTGGTTIMTILGLLLFVFPVVVTTNIIADRLTVTVRVRMANDVRIKLFRHLQSLSADFYTRNQLGDITARFAGDLDVIERVISDRTLNGVMAALAIAGYIAVLFYLNWVLTLATMIILLIMTPLIKRFAPRAMAAFYDIRQADARILNMVQENVRAQPVIRSFNLAERCSAIFQNHLNGFASRYIEAYFYSSLVDKAIIMIVIYVVILIAAGGAMMTQWQMTSAGTVVAFVSMLAVLSKDLLMFGNHFEHLLRASGGIRRIEELMRQQPGILESPQAVYLPGFTDEIRFENVSFTYTDDTPQLDRIDLKIPAGQYLAVVGPSGAGKSTLLRLLLRFYDISSGRVLIDGHDLREVTLESLRTQMGIVFQEPFIFDTNIRENIRLFNPDIPDQAVEKAARAAEIHEFIMNLPEGYDTLVGESGGRLSGGQRQRLAIARALIRDPAILLLDEVTSSLDARTAASINRTVEKLAGDRTIVAVTHNLRHAVQADLTIVLDRGRLVESGSHASLLTRRGIYYQLWQKHGIENDENGTAGQSTSSRQDESVFPL